jgi:hypothetical protein
VGGNVVQGEIIEYFIHFGGTVFSDRTTELRGVIVVGSTRLVAEPATTRSSCADTDGDGMAGIILLETVYRNVRSGEKVLVTITPVGTDIDQRDTYTLMVQIGDEVLTVEAQAFYGDGRRRA